MSEAGILMLAYILGVCGATAVACWATGSAWPLLGLLMLLNVSIKGGG